MTDYYSLSIYVPIKLLDLCHSQASPKLKLTNQPSLPVFDYISPTPADNVLMSAPHSSFHGQGQGHRRLAIRSSLTPHIAQPSIATHGESLPQQGLDVIVLSPYVVYNIFNLFLVLVNNHIVVKIYLICN